MQKNENTLFDIAAEKIGAKNDRRLAMAIGVDQPVISKIRHGRLDVGASLVIKLHEATGMTIKEIKAFVTRGAQVPSLAVKRRV